MAFLNSKFETSYIINPLVNKIKSFYKKAKLPLGVDVVIPFIIFTSA